MLFHTRPKSNIPSTLDKSLYNSEDVDIQQPEMSYPRRRIHKSFYAKSTDHHSTDPKEFTLISINHEHNQPNHNKTINPLYIIRSQKKKSKITLKNVD